MVKQEIIKFREFRMKRKYEILLVSFLVLLFGDVVVGPNFNSTPILIFQNVLASTIIFYGKRKWRYPLMLLLIFLASLFFATFLINIPKIGLLFFSVYIIYFLFLSVEVYRQILKTKDVDIGMIAAVLCGFIILGLIGGYVFSIIEIMHPNSFNNLTEGLGGMSDLIYFSFITIISIGYGDITPATDIAQKMSLFFGLIGYFYGVVVIGIIMGKYISQKHSK
ncbi:ion channel [Prolixibacteraceae bacterium Z1-6]|uniref:Ion channel n=1 Tax=Draconibacterium aestuarii TaxID=2998507 RepID=A0A9X3FA39_9BACT|nr:ion channel [Prolixibacteraceae bacterium Z1-6]